MGTGIRIKYTYKSNIKSNQRSNQIRNQNGQWVTKQRICKQKKNVCTTLHLHTQKIGQIQRSKSKQDTIPKFTFSTQLIQVQNVEMIGLGRCRSKNLCLIYK